MRFFIFLVLASMASIMSLSAQTLHSLVVYGDDRPINTDNDTRILEELSRNIAEFMQMNHNSLQINCDNEDSDTLESKIEEMVFGSDDIVLFYYQGRGGRSENDKSLFPQLFVKSNLLMGVSVNHIAQKLLDKKARFYLFLIDCSNVCVKGISPQEENRLVYQNNLQNSTNSSTPTLFSKQGYVIIASAGVGEYSYSTTEGSIFLRAFSPYIDEKKSEIDWNDVMTSFSIPIWTIREIKPIYDIFIK